MTQKTPGITLPFMIISGYLMVAFMPSVAMAADKDAGFSLLDLFVGTAYATSTGYCDCSVAEYAASNSNSNSNSSNSNNSNSNSSNSNSSSGNVTLCHKPGTTAENTISINSSAETAHLAHGDTSGACPGETEADALVDTGTPCTCPNGDPGTYVGTPPTVGSPDSLREVMGQ